MLLHVNVAIPDFLLQNRVTKKRYKILVPKAPLPAGVSPFRQKKKITAP